MPTSNVLFYSYPLIGIFMAYLFSKSLFEIMYKSYFDIIFILTQFYFISSYGQLITVIILMRLLCDIAYDNGFVNENDRSKIKKEIWTYLVIGICLHIYLSSLVTIVANLNNYIPLFMWRKYVFGFLVMNSFCFIPCIIRYVIC